MLERDIEAKLVREVKAMRGECLKWVSPGTIGVPDRIVILPGGAVIFVELKTDAGRLTKLQEYWNLRLNLLGCSAVVIRGEDDLERFLTIVRPVGWSAQAMQMIGDMTNADC